MSYATRPGDVLGDRYTLVDLLTESDGGRFWRAYDRVLERHVAIHVIRGDDERAPALMEAARRSATVPDRRVLRVLDAECTRDECYVVNEWGWGASLDVVVAGNGALGPRRAAWLVAEVADSIAAAHAAGVTHGRLNPENVLVDRAGGVRIIGLCVDAALHGIDDAPEVAAQRDVDDLAGLLYCALTTRWAGSSGSQVAAAPRGHGEVLRPRQVRAGIPRPLDLLCDEVLHRSGSRGAELGEAVTSARGVSDYLVDYVGDTTGMAEALLAATPDVLPDEEQVVLPPVPEMRPHDEDDDPTDSHQDPVPDVPTEAGVPIFGEDDDVSWLERRTTPAPPPPPFEAPPERPLFAPEPVAGTPARTPRPTPTPRSTGRDDDFWPWDTGAGASTSSASLAPVVDDSAPGRILLRLGVVLGVLVLVGLAVLVAVNRGGTDDSLSDDPTDDTSIGSGDGTQDPQARTVSSSPVTGVTASAFDPQGDGDENGEEAANAVDGDPDTTWRTSGYDDQLGPGGLKTGVGLLLDLGEAVPVDAVSLTLVGQPTSASIYVLDQEPTSLQGLDPVASGSTDGTRLNLQADGVTGSHVVVWLTSLPLGDDGAYRGEISDLVVTQVVDDE